MCFGFLTRSPAFHGELATITGYLGPLYLVVSYFQLHGCN